MKNATKTDTVKSDGVSTSALRLARVALQISQKDAAIACGIGWRTMQRLELDEPVNDEIRGKIAAEWERRGITFLNPDRVGWGIRVPRRDPEGPMGHETFKALRVGLALSVEEAAQLVGVNPREINAVENSDDAPDDLRNQVRDAYTAAGVKFMFPGKGGWGFRIPEKLSPERGRVILMRPRRKGPAPKLPETAPVDTAVRKKRAAAKAAPAHTAAETTPDPQATAVAHSPKSKSKSKSQTKPKSKAPKATKGASAASKPKAVTRGTKRQTSKSQAPKAEA